MDTHTHTHTHKIDIYVAYSDSCRPQLLVCGFSKHE